MMSGMINKRKKRGLLRELLDIPVGVCIVLIVAFVAAGSLFIFFRMHYGDIIEREEAICESAVFESYVINVGRYSSVIDVELHLEGGRLLFVDGECYNASLGDALDRLSGGEQLDMLLHPTTGAVLEIRCGEDTLLRFEDAIDGMIFENIGFAVIGTACYLCAAVPAVSLVARGVKKLKKRNTGRG